MGVRAPRFGPGGAWSVLPPPPGSLERLPGTPCWLWPVSLRCSQPHVCPRGPASAHPTGELSALELFPRGRCFPAHEGPCLPPLPVLPGLTTTGHWHRCSDLACSPWAPPASSACPGHALSPVVRDAFHVPSVLRALPRWRLGPLAWPHAAPTDSSEGLLLCRVMRALSRLGPSGVCSLSPLGVQGPWWQRPPARAAVLRGPRGGRFRPLALL